MEPGRDAFLARVRAALRVGHVSATSSSNGAKEPAVARLEDERASRREALARLRPLLVSRFRDEAERVGVRVRGPVAAGDVTRTVGEGLAAHRARRIVASPRGFALPEGFDVLSGRDGALAADAGVTRCDFAIAESGTLVVIANEDAPRLPSLEPKIHLAILRIEDILEVPADLFLFLSPGAPPSSIVFITGPSRTGDIEQTLTVGVHGPGVVEVVLVAEGTPSTR
ncbi:MAG: lactate utilization protein [Planctomycetes bacterium]|nr:lactate utilization protein [Planctomycetota bacterium]